MGYHRGSCTVRRTWIGCARRKTAQHFRKQGATKNLFGIDLFSHISSHPKMMQINHVILRPATDPSHLGTVPAHLVYILPKVLPLNKAIDWNLTWSSWSLLANRPYRAKDVTVVRLLLTHKTGFYMTSRNTGKPSPQCHHSPENEGLIEGVWSPSLFVNNPRSLGQLGRLFPGIRFSWCWKQIWSSWNLVMPWWFLAWTSSDHWMSYCWWREIRGSPVEVDSLSHCLHGCKNARWLAGFLSHQQ